MNKDENIPSIHLDFHFFFENKGLENRLRIQRNRTGQIRYKLSLYTMGEIMEHIRRGRNIHVEGLKNIIDDIFVPKREQLDQIIEYVKNIIENDNRLELTDAFIVASALTDPSCIALMTADSKIIGSKIIKKLAEKRNPKLKLHELPYDDY